MITITDYKYVKRVSLYLLTTPMANTILLSSILMIPKGSSINDATAIKGEGIKDFVTTIS